MRRWRKELIKGFLCWAGCLCAASCCVELVRYDFLYSLKWGWSPMRIAEIPMGIIGIVYVAWALVVLSQRD